MNDLQGIANTTALTKSGNNEPRVEITINIVDSPAELKVLNDSARNSDVQLLHTQYPTKRIAKGTATSIIRFLVNWQKHNGWTLQTVANMFPKLAWATAEYQEENFPHSSADDAVTQGGEEQ